MLATRGKPSIGFDTDQKISRQQAKDLFSAGFLFAGRYLRLPGNNSSEDIDRNELEDLTNAGLQVLLFQHVRQPGWHPSASRGELDAMEAVQHAKELDGPENYHIVLDLEGVSGSSDDTFAHATEWCQYVCSNDLKAAIYVGFGVPLTSAQLYAIQHANQYIRGGSVRLEVDTRGYSVKQFYPQVTICGVTIDVDIMLGDQLGDFPIMISG